MVYLLLSEHFESLSGLLKAAFLDIYLFYFTCHDTLTCFSILLMRDIQILTLHINMVYISGFFGAVKLVENIRI